MSLDLFQPFDGLGGLCALARDEELRLVWCNDEFTRVEGHPAAALLGTPPGAVMCEAAARERSERMRAVLADGRMVSFYQVWKGARWLNRVWPLDQRAFGHGGVFVVMHKSVDPPSAASVPGRPPVAMSLVSDLGDLGVLTRRELEVLYWMATGMSINDIAAGLFRSPKTIGRHAESIHRKMGYTNRAELVLDAARRGLIGFTSEEWGSLVRAF